MSKSQGGARRGHMGLRLEIIDELLGSVRRRNYKDLLELLNERLEENGDVAISARTLKYDIECLEKKGAPIHRPTKMDPFIYYTEKFSLKQIPIDDEDIQLLKDAVAILKKATNFNLTGEVDKIISRLENRIYTNVPEGTTLIAFEEHTEAAGKEYFEPIFSAIREKSPIRIRYRPFKKEILDWVIHPYMLKEYRNRWFLIGRESVSNQLVNLRLDSIKDKIRNSAETFLDNNLFDPEVYFNHVIGVTIPKGSSPFIVKLRVNADSADYVRTKPIHKSQIILSENKNGSIVVEFSVFNNYELKSNLLGYGPAVEVLEPESLREEMKMLFLKASKIYEKG